MPKFKNSNATFWVFFLHCENAQMALTNIFATVRAFLQNKAHPSTSMTGHNKDLFCVYDKGLHFVSER